jgi:hypothetical protein
MIYFKHKHEASVMFHEIVQRNCIYRKKMHCSARKGSTFNIIHEDGKLSQIKTKMKAFQRIQQFF